MTFCVPLAVPATDLLFALSFSSEFGAVRLLLLVGNFLLLRLRVVFRVLGGDIVQKEITEVLLRKLGILKNSL